MSDSNNSNNPVDLTGPDEPAKKLPKLLTGILIDRTSFDLHGQVTAHCLVVRRGRHENPYTVQPFLASSSL